MWVPCGDCWEECNTATGEVTQHCNPQPCTPQCACAPGFTRDPVTSACMACADTVISCPVNERYNDLCHDHCGPSCDMSCDNQAFPCTAGCECEPGLYRNALGACVHAQACEVLDCPDPNAYWEPCNGQCHSYCDVDGFFVKECNAASDGMICHPHCACKDGYMLTGNFMNDDVYCEVCLMSMCGANEEYSDCAITCGQHCFDASAQCPPQTDCQAGIDSKYFSF